MQLASELSGSSTAAALMIGLYLLARLLGRPTSPGQVVGCVNKKKENVSDCGPFAAAQSRTRRWRAAG